MENNRIISNKWIATVSSIWIQCSSGASYAFGIYSSVLKSSQDYSQSTLDTISVFKDIGANVGVLSGLLYSAVTADHGRRLVGPWVVHLAGAIICFAGYFLIWLSVVGFIYHPPVPLMCVFVLAAAQAQTFFNTANVVTAVHNFPDYSGTIVGIMKGFLGLSGAILIQFYQAIFKGNATTFILMLALLPTIVPLLLMCLVNIYQTSTGDDKKHLNGFSAAALIIAAYLTVSIILENIFSLPLWARLLIFVLLLVLLSLPLGIGIKAHKENLHRLAHTSSIDTRLLLDDREAEESKKLSRTSEEHLDQQAMHDSEDHEEKEDMNLLQAMKTGNFWLLFVAMICGLGSGLATINNMSQIGESLGYTTVEINTLISLWSIWNFLGRFGSGYVSDLMLHSSGWARPIFMAITQATMSVGHMVIASGFSENLYIGTIIVGVCYGSQWSLMPTIASEIFGVGHLGTIFNTIAIASPIGSYILSVRVIGYIYDSEAGEGNSCSGSKCFMLSFFIMACVTFFGFFVSLTLFFRTRGFYRRVVLRRLHHTSSNQ
ncbi:Major facilitator superfamily [Dillenia turbinata]|uniref:Major facilitator superfamily n=1 Tax=Dillenia turbinata TaxID=194707 RepID=A0AAN8V004_9MAGN